MANDITVKRIVIVFVYWFKNIIPPCLCNEHTVNPINTCYFVEKLFNYSERLCVQISVPFLIDLCIYCCCNNEKKRGAPCRLFYDV